MPLRCLLGPATPSRSVLWREAQEAGSCLTFGVSGTDILVGPDASWADVLARLDEISNGEPSGKYTDESDHAVGQHRAQESEYQRPTQPREYQGGGYQGGGYQGGGYQGQDHQGQDGWTQSPAANVVEKLFFADIERRVRRNEETLADLLTTMRALTGVR